MILNKGFRLFQPWANSVVDGNINFLVRKFPTKMRGRVAVIASRKIDPIWVEKANNQDIRDLENRIGAIGSVEIKDCIEVKPGDVKNKLKKLAGNDYLDYYPAHLLNDTIKVGNLYIWILKNSKNGTAQKKLQQKEFFGQIYLWKMNKGSYIG